MSYASALGTRSSDVRATCATVTGERFVVVVETDRSSLTRAIL
jgi:hypothetical protein